MTLDPAGYRCTVCHRPAKDEFCMDNCTPDCDGTEKTPKEALYTKAQMVFAADAMREQAMKSVKDMGGDEMVANVDTDFPYGEELVRDLINPPPPRIPLADVLKVLRNA